jgi:hypothetical protein
MPISVTPIEGSVFLDVWTIPLTLDGENRRPPRVEPAWDRKYETKMDSNPRCRCARLIGGNRPSQRCMEPLHWEMCARVGASRLIDGSCQVKLFVADADGRSVASGARR